MNRALNFCIASIIIVVLSPIMLVVSGLILIRMGRPILFCQERPGYLGRPFTLYKFRSMTESCLEADDMSDDKDRLTKLGETLRKYSLDELPSLVNVILGDMNLVGPRPLLMEYLPLYNNVHSRRHDVRPGITGWAQINGRNSNSWEKKFDMDVWYVDNRSLLLDIVIIFKTFLTIAKPSGINDGNGVGQKKFNGYG